MNYVATFITGFEKQVLKLLKEKIPDVKIIEYYNGLVFFNVNKQIEISSLPFFNNIYLLINKNNIKSKDFNNNIKDVIKTKINYNEIKNIIAKGKCKTFKIKAFKENQPTKFDYKLVGMLEKDINKFLNLKISNNPDIEFVFQERKEGFILFMLKLTNNRLTEKNIQKGSLKPEMSYLLVSLANLKETDIVIDPFFGTGSIPKTIIKYFKYNMCFASDVNHECVINLKNEYKNNKKKLYIKEKNATNLNCFENDFIDVIITDPPWNIYKTNESIDYYKFYKEMLLEFSRILKSNGRIIILMGNQVFEKSLNDVKDFNLIEKLSILVNGKKANIYYFIKK